jgi:CheY-like chemotaxis protein
MARFLICEPHADIRRLYAAVVRGLGHEPVSFDRHAVAEPDVVLVEPADRELFEAARRLREQNPDLPIICASIYEPTHVDVEVLGALRYLLKPFGLVELTNALELALLQREVCR